jgi:hypothetical protein
MIILARGCVKVTVGSLIYAISLVESPQTMYPTQKQHVSGQLMLTLAYLTTKGIQHIWQIKLDNMARVTGVYLM